ncbi:sphingolipid delta-4 desaturase [Kwoniella heveanensis BCC8398]|uniref:sphingolipid 4-desaturase n=1 Tax=Kwoniella heveanensis BCC8398 TaxID=1296120 RepID=A0A1B9GL67_9TREE|nr:sphingolipid delta-4 desaturase [Kwoniella heveanensis BCC8398]
MAISSILPVGKAPATPYVRPSVKRADTDSVDTDPSTTSSPSLSSYDPSDQEMSGDERVTTTLSSSRVGKGGVGAAAEVQADVDEREHNPDFLWMTTEEPHRSRRIAILKAHPEVRKLMGPTSLTFPIVLLVLSIQLTCAYLLRNSHPFSWPFLATAYAVGGTANQNIFLAIHEITHNLAFKSIRANKILAIVANLSIGVPYAMAFKGYHIEHHKFLGEDGIDTDLPSKFEAMVLNNVAGKTFFATFQILFYALRPGFIRSQTPTRWHAINLLSILSFDYLLVHFLGWKPLIYLIMSSFFAGSLHPCAAHFIAEHYLMEGPDEDWLIKGLAQETTSYYGWLNILCYNVGYHNEHHDFPSVPWTRLPQLRAIASEYYDPLPSHKSWPYVTWKFITDPSVGMWSRAKREGRGEKIEPNTWNGALNTGVDANADVGISVQEVEEEEEIAYMSDTEKDNKSCCTSIGGEKKRV